MNSLTWTLYLVGILPNVGFVLGFFAILSGIFVLVHTLYVLIENDTDLDISRGRIPAKKYLRTRFFMLPIVLGFLSALVPDQLTLYSMLASELGEQVAVSDVGQEVLTEIKEVISYQLESLKGGDE